jgi:hypothetical protein
VGHHQQEAQGLSLLPGASPGVLPHPPRLGAFEKEDEMKPIPLFESDESVEDLCLLIKSLHQEMSTMHRKVDVLLAFTSPALSVVPNEDEAMPVTESETRLAYCKQCSMTAYTDADVERFFGWRTPAGRPTIVQSWCRECRKLGKLPDSVTKFWREANALRKQADAKRAERVEVLEASRGRENKESVELVIEEADLRIEVRRLVAEYDKARRAFRKGESDETSEN